MQLSKNFGGDSIFSAKQINAIFGSFFLIFALFKNTEIEFRELGLLP